MTDEEKKAIERIEDIIYTHNDYGINHFKKITLHESGINDIQTILNLIQKQQKEIEKKDEIINEMTKHIRVLEENVEGYSGLAKQIEQDYRHQTIL